MDEARGTYRGEVLVIMGALADIHADTGEIRAMLEGSEEDGDEEETDS